MTARARAAAKRKKPRLAKLYWCSTDDHGEDWFVVAGSVAEACRFHEDAEGYDRGDADADLVCALPKALSDAKTGWPSDDVLVACGGEIVTRNPREARVVRIRGYLFSEGDVVELAAARAGLVPKH